jgi:hypothetical protein
VILAVTRLATEVDLVESDLTSLAVLTSTDEESVISDDFCPLVFTFLTLETILDDGTSFLAGFSSSVKLLSSTIFLSLLFCLIKFSFLSIR